MYLCNAYFLVFSMFFVPSLVALVCDGGNITRNKSVDKKN
jgi:hypothetical protein